MAPSPPDRTLSPGDAVTFVVAADLVEIGKAPPEGHNTVACQLISEEFVGLHASPSYLEAPDGTEFKVQLQ